MNALMKRRAQTAAAPAVAKRKKLAKDEVLESETYASGAVQTGDRASKPRSLPSNAPLASSPTTSRVTSTASPRNAADNIARRTRDDSPLSPITRSPQPSAPLHSSPPMYTMPQPSTKASKSAQMDVDINSSSASSSQLPSNLAPLVMAPLTLNSPICWARVNRMAWWPGKVCTHVWTPGSAYFPASTFRDLSMAWSASGAHHFS